MRKLLITLLAAIFTIAGLTPARAAEIKVQDNLQLVAGERIELYQCSNSVRPADLHYRFDRSWIRLAKSNTMLDTEVCKDRKMPIKHLFKFKVPMIYQSIEPNTKYAKMLIRLIGPKQQPKLFTATVFATQAEKTQVTGETQPVSVKTDWAKCIYNGRLMTGRVKVVSFDANYRVKLVQLNPDLLVTESRGRPMGCGSWQFVNQNFDFTIQLVTEAEDFTIAISRQRGNRP